MPETTVTVRLAFSRLQYAYSGKKYILLRAIKLTIIFKAWVTKLQSFIIRKINITKIHLLLSSGTHTALEYCIFQQGQYYHP